MAMQTEHLSRAKCDLQYQVAYAPSTLIPEP